MQGELPVIRDGLPVHRSWVAAVYVRLLEGRIVAFIRYRLTTMQRRSSLVPVFRKQSELPV